MTDKKIDSLKHKKATRARIPSKEEAGFEPDQPSKAELPLNPVTTVSASRGIVTSIFFRLCTRAPCT